MTKADTSDRVVRKEIFEKVAFDYKSEGSLGASHMDSWRKNFQKERTAGANVLRWEEHGWRT